MSLLVSQVGTRNLSRPFRLTERRREYIAFLLLILPNVTFLVVWTYWPFIYSIYLSLTNWNILKVQKQFVGLDNYLKLLQSPDFWQVVSNTVTFTLGTVFVRLAISLALAVLLNQQLRALGFWRLIVFSPHITTMAAMALVWVSIYDPYHGPIADLLSAIGISFPYVLRSSTYALPAVMMVAIWKAIGFSTVVFLAALQGVAQDLKDAAAVDGANAWQSFWNVSFPSISPVTYFLVVTGLIGSFQTFDLIQVMTGGGPVNATQLYVVQLYDEGFHFFRMGYGSALAVLMFTVLMAFTYLQTRLSARWVHYQ